MAPKRPPRAPARASRLEQALEAHGLVLLYDGNCGLCHRFVRLLLRADRGAALRFAALQGPLGDEARRRAPQLVGVDSLIMVHREGAWVRSTAAIEALRAVGGVWSLAVLGYLMPRGLRDWIYDRVARRRYEVFGRLENCPLPAPEQRERFLN